MNPTNRPVTTVESSVTLTLPAGVVAAFALDWGNDHLWRSHVRSVRCSPTGRAVAGQQLVEELRFAGLTFVTTTVVDDADRLQASYAGGNASMVVTGMRVVVPLDEQRCELRTTTRMLVGGLLRAFAPALTVSYRRADAADLRALPAALAAHLTTAGTVTR